MDPSRPSRPSERARRRPLGGSPPPPLAAPHATHGEAHDEARGAGDAAPSFWIEEAAPPAVIRLEPAPLLVVARFRGVRVASRLLVAEPRLRRRCRAHAAFHIGADRAADAPVNPAYIAGARRHPLLALVALDGAAPDAAPNVWAVSLAPAMRVELRHGAQRLALDPDPPAVASAGVRAPLALPAESTLSVHCGEMTYEIVAAGDHAPLPRPYLGPGWRREGRYLLASALALGLVVVSLYAIPADSRALSLDDIGRTIRLAKSWTVPPVLPEPPPAPGARADTASRGGGGAAPGPKGQTGDHRAPPASRRLAAARRPLDDDPAPLAQQAAEQAAMSGFLGILRADRSSALAKVLEKRSALGDDAADVLAHMRGVEVSAAWGLEGLTADGGRGHGDDGRELIGTGGTLHTLDGRGRGPGGNGWGSDNVAKLGPPRGTQLPSVIPSIASVRGALDKEIVRRIVRLHLNEVRYCYEQELPRHPGLAGRLVMQFAIAGTGQVITSFVQSSTLGEPRVGQCVSEAVRRWPFPRPQGGGMVVVSYPFQLQPAGS